MVEPRRPLPSPPPLSARQPATCLVTVFAWGVGGSFAVSELSGWERVRFLDTPRSPLFSAAHGHGFTTAAMQKHSLGPFSGLCPLGIWGRIRGPEMGSWWEHGGSQGCVGSSTMGGGAEFM